MTMKTGTVKFYNQEKAFGFIKPEDGSKDVFVHRSGIVNHEILNEGDQVSFEVREEAKGPSAFNVERV